MAVLYREVELSNSQGLSDIDVACENLMEIFLNSLLTVNLVNVNSLYNKANFPGIDLIDEEARLAVQVSAQDSSQKIKHTIDECNKSDSLNGFHIMFVALKNKATKHQWVKFNSGIVQFDVQSDIIDGSWILSRLKALDTYSQNYLNAVLKEFLGLENYQPVSVAEALRYTGEDFSRYLPPNYLPRVLRSNDDKSHFDRILHPENYQAHPLFDFVMGETEVKASDFVIFCSPQSGKTTELLYLAYQLQKETELKPIFIKATDLCKLSGTSLIHLPPNYYKHEIVLLIDGLDEVDADKMSDLDEGIREFASGNPLCKVVVTCRSNFSSENILKDFNRLELMGLTKDDIVKYMRHNGIWDAEDLFEEIIRKQLFEFVSKPFFLNAFVDYYNQNKKMPETKFLLYDFWIEKSFKADEKGKGMIPLKDEARMILQRLAVLMQLSNREEVTISELTGEAGIDSEKIKKCLHYAIFKYKDDKCSFEHNAFREFYAAKALSVQPLPEIKKLICYDGSLIVKKSWNNTVMLCLSAMHSQNRDNYDNFIEWLLTRNANIMMYADPAVLSDDVKLSILKFVLADNKRKNVFPENFFEMTSTLANICCTKDTLRYLLDEYKATTVCNRYFANLSDVIRFLDFRIVEDYGMEDSFEEAIFIKIAEFGAVDDEKTENVYSALYNPYFQKESIIERLIHTEVDCIGNPRFRIIAEMVSKQECTNKFVTFLIENKDKFDNYHIGGYCHLVFKGALFASLSKSTDVSYVDAILQFAEDYLRNGHSYHEDEIVHIIVSQVKVCEDNAITHPELCHTLFNHWLNISKLHTADTVGYRAITTRLRNFLRQYWGEQCVMDKRAELLAKINAEQKGLYDEFEKFRGLLQLFSGDITPESLLDGLDSDNPWHCQLAYFCRSAGDEKWNKHMECLLEKTFPQYRRQMNKWDIWEAEEREILFDHIRLKNEICNILDRYNPKDSRELFASVKEDEEMDKIPAFIYSYMGGFVNAETKLYSINDAKAWIENADNYKLFFLDYCSQNSVMRGKLDDKQKDKFGRCINEYLGKEYRSASGPHRLITVLMESGLDMDENLIPRYIGYASIPRQTEFIGRKSCDNSFLGYAVSRIGEDAVVEAITRVLSDYSLAYSDADLQTICLFAIENNLTGLFDSVIDVLKKDGFEYGREIVQAFVAIPNRGTRLLERHFDAMNASSKLAVLSALIDDANQKEWLLGKILEYRDSFTPFRQNLILGFLLKLGYLPALKECDGILRTNPEYFGDITVPELKFTTMEAFPVLKDMLRYTVGLKLEPNQWPSAIIYAMQRIVVNDADATNDAVELFEDLASSSSRLSYLFNTADSFRYAYCEHSTEVLSISQAAKKVLMLLPSMA